MLEIASAEACAVSAVQATHESKLPYYGAVGARRLPGRAGLYQVDRVLEKPTPTVAEQKLIVPGLRAGHYLCFFGMHVLTPGVMDILQRTRDGGGRTAACISPTPWPGGGKRTLPRLRIAGPPL